mgnify:CR=1 FL=1
MRGAAIRWLSDVAIQTVAAAVVYLCLGFLFAWGAT